eukprot:jgi/Psemu1/7344/gm1.7344_g
MAVLATLLGATHDVVKHYQQGLSRLEWQQMPLCRAIADEVGEHITPAIVVYYFQVRVQGWLEEQWESNTTLPSPDFGEDIHRFRMTQNLNWLPNVSNDDALRALQQPTPPPHPPRGRHELGKPKHPLSVPRPLPLANPPINVLGISTGNDVMANPPSNVLGISTGTGNVLNPPASDVLANPSSNMLANPPWGQLYTFKRSYDNKKYHTFRGTSLHNQRIFFPASISEPFT